MRQPHDRNASGEIHVLSPTKRRFARMKPTGAPSRGNVPQIARLPGGAFSVARSRTRPFAAEADTLAEAQKDEEERGEDDPARRRGRGQEADEERADAHDEQGCDERLLPPHPVAEVAEDDRPDGAGDEGDAEDRERAEHLRRRRLIGEEEGGEDERRRGRVRVEVEELDRRADHRGREDLASGVVLPGRGDPVGLRRRLRAGLCFSGHVLVCSAVVMRGRHGRWCSCRTD